MTVLKIRRVAVPGLLFALTLLFTMVIGVQYHVSFYDVSLPAGRGFWAFLSQHPAAWLWGLSYSLPLLGILLVHEMGHFLACRRHGLSRELPALDSGQFSPPAPAKPADERQLTLF